MRCDAIPGIQYPIPNPHRNSANNVYNNFININKCSRSVCFSVGRPVIYALCFSTHGSKSGGKQQKLFPARLTRLYRFYSNYELLIGSLGYRLMCSNTVCGPGNYPRPPWSSIAMLAWLSGLLRGRPVRKTGERRAWLGDFSGIEVRNRLAVIIED